MKQCSIIIFVFLVSMQFAAAFSFGENFRYGFNNSANDGASSLNLNSVGSPIYVPGGLAEGSHYVDCDGNDAFYTSFLQVPTVGLPKLSFSWLINISSSDLQQNEFWYIIGLDGVFARQNFFFGLGKYSVWESTVPGTAPILRNVTRFIGENQNAGIQFSSSNLNDTFFNKTLMVSVSIAENQPVHIYVNATEIGMSYNPNFGYFGALRGMMSICSKMGDTGVSNLTGFWEGGTDDFRIWFDNLSRENWTTLYKSYFPSMSPSPPPDISPPVIKWYNLTDNLGCLNWNTNKNSPCTTSSVTPTVKFTTNENAWCAIGGTRNNGSLNRNYQNMGATRSCIGAFSGEGTTIHKCTLTAQDELVYENSYLFISCKDARNNQNINSTSGPLKVYINSLESNAKDSIGRAVQKSLLSSYGNLSNQLIVARSLSNLQVQGIFDQGAKKGMKAWVFNRIGLGESHIKMFNLTPVLYTMEFANMTSSSIMQSVEKFMNATK